MVGSIVISIGLSWWVIAGIIILLTTLRCTESSRLVSNHGADDNSTGWHGCDYFVSYQHECWPAVCPCIEKHGYQARLAKSLDTFRARVADPTKLPLRYVCFDRPLGHHSGSVISSFGRRIRISGFGNTLPGDFWSSLAGRLSRSKLFRPVGVLRLMSRSLCSWLNVSLIAFRAFRRRVFSLFIAMLYFTSVVFTAYYKLRWHFPPFSWQLVMQLLAWPVSESIFDGLPIRVVRYQLIPMRFAILSRRQPFLRCFVSQITMRF